MSDSGFVEKDFRMAILQFVPLLAMVAIILATLWRGFAIQRATGDRPWAFASAKGVQRIAGSSFALSVAALLVAAALATTGDTNWTIVAAIFALIGAAIVIAAQVQMGRAWRVGVREGDAPLFVSHGLFRYSRNPIFVGMMLVGLAAAMVSGAWWSWIALTIFIASCAVQVRIEEAHLEASFGQSYRNFRALVPRWIGIGGST
jgi:protein-S-isoprenylcysteine O-methyltransferase Ste14